MTGPEYQLIDDKGFAEPLEDWQRCGVDYAMYLPDFATMNVRPAGGKILTDYPTYQGSLGTAISEAVELAMQTPNCK